MFDMCPAKLKVRQEGTVKVTACKSYYAVLTAEFYRQPRQFV